MPTIVAECPNCDEIDLRTKVDHEPDSRQFEGVKDAHRLLVEEHNKGTDHGACVRVNTDE